MHGPGEIRVTAFPNDRAAARAVAKRIAEQVQAKPDLVLGLATGRTPVRLYHELVSLVLRKQLDLSRIRSFNLDEFLGIGPDHPGSYRRFMDEHLFKPAGIPDDQIGFLNGAAPDPAAECERYEEAIAAAGGIDVQILGIGTNGHIGFNEPAPELDARTHRVTLKPETRRSNAALFGGDESRVPREALSMGMGTILRARSIVLLATGSSKAGCIERVIRGGVTTSLPASFLQLHGDVDVMVDEAAAGKLGGNRS
jgi:glucosamine-6-phosphate deaminase